MTVAWLSPHQHPTAPMIFAGPFYMQFNCYSWPANQPSSMQTAVNSALFPGECLGPRSTSEDAGWDVFVSEIWGRLQQRSSCRLLWLLELCSSCCRAQYDSLSVTELWLLLLLLWLYAYGFKARDMIGCMETNFSSTKTEDKQCSGKLMEINKM